MGHSPRAAHRDILQKLRELFQLEITLFGFPFLIIIWQQKQLYCRTQGARGLADRTKTPPTYSGMFALRFDARRRAL